MLHFGNLALPLSLTSFHHWLFWLHTPRRSTVQTPRKTRSLASRLLRDGGKTSRRPSHLSRHARLRASSARSGKGKLQPGQLSGISDPLHGQPSRSVHFGTTAPLECKDGDQSKFRHAVDCTDEWFNEKKKTALRVYHVRMDGPAHGTCAHAASSDASNTLRDERRANVGTVRFDASSTRASTETSQFRRRCLTEPIAPPINSYLLTQDGDG